MAKGMVHVVGFGSQGSTWAQCLKSSGWDVQVYFSRKGESYQRALNLGFEPLMLEDLASSLQDPSSRHWVAMMCPDPAVAEVYDQYLGHLDRDIRLILAHGYSVYSEELVLKSARHQATLLAPKAIGPKLLQHFRNSYPHPHRLVAAFSASTQDSEMQTEIARGLGFDADSLVPCNFNEETMGDLISEQGLLCGGVFNLLEWTFEAMAEAGIPAALIREECLTELELIAGMIRERGPAHTLASISQAAQAGTIAMGKRLAESGFKDCFKAQVQSIQNRGFISYFKSREWEKEAEAFQKRFSTWEKKLQKPITGLST